MYGMIPVQGNDLAMTAFSRKSWCDVVISMIFQNL